MPIKIKAGMSGSRNGRSRYEKTEILKEFSKPIRRNQGKAEIKNELLSIDEVQQEKYE